MNIRLAGPPLVSLCGVFCMGLSGCSPVNTVHPEQPATQRVAAFSGKNAAPPGTHASESTTASNSFRARGTVADLTRSPRPGSVPYKDALIGIRLTNVRAESAGVPKEIVAYVWGMKDNQTTPASRIEQGQDLSLTLRPWEAVEDQYGGYNRVELSDPKALTLKAYWGEVR